MSEAPAARVWLAAAALLAAIVAAVEWTDRPPAPLPVNAPAAEFSEARARPAMVYLADSIGHREIGTAGRDRASAYLVSALRRIAGVEVQVQEWAGPYRNPLRDGTVELVHIRNVLARVAGDSASAVLVSAHYDTPPESVGAGDNAAGVAAALEMVHALAAGPRLRHSVIVNFNDGEESGLLGSAAFLHHPWAREVRAFVNLESAGPRGKAVLFQAGPGNAWLVRAYARAVPHPYGTVLAQDVFASGVIPSDTDFRIYRDAGGLRGLDVALYQDGYAYHTALDRPGRVQPGSIQHLGANTLAVVRELASGALPGDVGGEAAVYYDVLGQTMLAYSAGTARRLAALALAAVAGALVLAWSRTRLSVAELLAGAGVTTLAVATGLLLPIATSLVLPFGLGRPHGWFAAPWLAWTAWGALALAGVIAVHALWARRTDERAAFAIFAGGVLVWGVALALLTWAGWSSAYLALVWALPGAAGLALWSVRPRWWPAALALAWIPGAVLTMQAGILLLKLFVPVAGRFPAPIPFDPAIAALVAGPVAALTVTGAAAFHRARGMGRVAAGLAGVGAAGVIALALAFPYTAARPKRLWIQHQVQGSSAVVRVGAADWISPGGALAAAEGETFRPVDGSRFTYQRPAARPRLPPLSLSVDAAAPAGADSIRAVRLRLGRGAYRAVALGFPRGRVVGVSAVGQRVDASAGEPIHALRIYPPPPGGWDATLHVRGGAPVRAEVTEIFAPARTPALDRVVRRLPPWATPFTSVVRKRTLAF